MVTASVIILFEAVSAAEAESKMAGWNLHEGCRVTISITEGQTISSGVIDSGSNLVIDIPEVPDEPSG